jgi:putative transposase
MLKQVQAKPTETWNLRIKLRRRIKRDKPEALSVPSKINQTWSMDFMADSLTDGRSIRVFNVIDDHNRILGRLN